MKTEKRNVEREMLKQLATAQLKQGSMETIETRNVTFSTQKGRMGENYQGHSQTVALAQVYEKSMAQQLSRARME